MYDKFGITLTDLKGFVLKSLNSFFVQTICNLYPFVALWAGVIFITKFNYAAGMTKVVSKTVPFSSILPSAIWALSTLFK